MALERSKLKNRLFLTVEDIAETQGIALSSAHVLCSRYVRQGILIRLKKNFYVLDRNWEHYERKDFFRICNFFQVPSYISCMTALGFFGITTQVQRDWYENIAQRRSLKAEARGIVFSYHKISRPLFFGFAKQDGFFIAAPEKAFLDSVYLHSLGRYPLDWSSLNLGALNRETLLTMMEPFPAQVRRRVRKACEI